MLKELVINKLAIDSELLTAAAISFANEIITPKHMRCEDKEVSRRFRNAISVANEGGLDISCRDLRWMLDQYLPKPYFQKLLMVGCGLGSEVYYAKIHGYDAYGVTLSEHNKMFASKYLNLEKEVFLEDIHCTHFENNYFDAILCFQSFEHFLIPVLALVEIYRILRNGGIFILELPPSSVMSEKCGGMTHLWCPTPRQIKSMLEGTGFGITKIYLQEVPKWLDLEIDNNFLDCCDSSFQVYAYKDERHGNYARRILVDSLSLYNNA